MPSANPERRTPSMEGERLLLWRCNCGHVNVRDAGRTDSFMCSGCRFMVEGVRVFAFDEVGEVE